MKFYVAATAGAALVIFGSLLTYALIHKALRTSPAETVQLVPPPALLHTAPPGAPPITLVANRPIAPQTAEAINRAVPMANAGPAARPFNIASGTLTWDRASRCLAQAIFYEAGSEPVSGQKAVAQVVLNRVRSPAFPDSVCGVVYQGSERNTGCQFTFTCDGSLARKLDGPAWHKALSIAASALQGSVFRPVGNATHYHANYVVPYWAASMAKIQAIGAHDFYRWPGKWRASTYFSQRYANVEPNVAGSLLLSGSMPAVEPSPAAPLENLPALEAEGARHAAKFKTLAIDEQPHTLFASQHRAVIDPKLDQAVNLQADIHASKLEPAPAPQPR